MALFKPGPAVADVRGKLGGVVFSRNSSGNYMRNNTKPVFPGTPKQEAQKAQMSVVVASWQNDLTVAQRDEWNGLASRTIRSNRLGEGITPSGQNLYTRANMLLLQTGQTPIVIPPVNPEIPMPTLTLTWTTLVGVEITSINGWDNSGTGKVLCSISPALRQTINFYKGPFISQQVLDNTDFDTLPHLLLAPAAITANTRLHIRFVAVLADGGASAGVFNRVDIGTPV